MAVFPAPGPKVAAVRGAPPIGTIGVALLDLSTGEFSAAEYAGSDGLQALADELTVLRPREIIVPISDNGVASAALSPVAASGLPTTPIEAWAFELDSARRTLLDQLRAGGLEGFGLDGHPAAVAAAGALVQHLRAARRVDLAHVRSIAYRQRADALLVDPTTLKHLEILEDRRVAGAGRCSTSSIAP
jgi:DNA mismatch repair protein MutS